MSAETALYSALTVAPGVTALVGTRIYPQRVPQEATLPAISYRRISTLDRAGHDGPGGVQLVRIEVTAEGETYREVAAVLDAVEAALNAQLDVVTGIHVARLIQRRDGVYGELTELHVGQLDFMLTTKE